MNPKTKSGQKAPNLKSYYEYHIWGFQKGKNCQNIPILRGCMNFKNLAFTLGWAQSVSNFFSKNGFCLTQIELGQKNLTYFYLMYVKCQHEVFLAKFWIFGHLWASLYALLFEFRTLYLLGYDISRKWFHYLF